MSGDGAVTVPKTSLREFDAAAFRTYLLPQLLGVLPLLDVQTATKYAVEGEAEAHRVGLRVLLHRYHHLASTWETFRRVLVGRPSETLDPFIAYTFAHIPWHGDLTGPVVAEPLRSEVARDMRVWGRAELLALVSVMDDNGIQRGSVGQSVYAIADLSVDGSSEILRSIAFDDSASVPVRNNGLLLFAFVAQAAAKPDLERAVKDRALTERAEILLAVLETDGNFQYD